MRDFGRRIAVSVECAELVTDYIWLAVRERQILQPENSRFVLHLSVGCKVSSLGVLGELTVIRVDGAVHLVQHALRLVVGTSRAVRGCGFERGPVL